ncbi:hypothetical protein GOP47_0031124 [Adiantum capillus-veneris]|nr:hypothetical protein GOP47_0031124 [Adiantum capillus-veneris]
MNLFPDSPPSSPPRQQSPAPPPSQEARHADDDAEDGRTLSLLEDWLARRPKIDWLDIQVRLFSRELALASAETGPDLVLGRPVPKDAPNNVDICRAADPGAPNDVTAGAGANASNTQDDPVFAWEGKAAVIMRGLVGCSPAPQLIGDLADPTLCPAAAPTSNGGISLHIASAALMHHDVRRYEPSSFDHKGKTVMYKDLVEPMDIDQREDADDIQTRNLDGRQRDGVDDMQKRSSNGKQKQMNGNYMQCMNSFDRGPPASSSLLENEKKRKVTFSTKDTSHVQIIKQQTRPDHIQRDKSKNSKRHRKEEAMAPHQDYHPQYIAVASHNVFNMGGSASTLTQSEPALSHKADNKITTIRLVSNNANKLITCEAKDNTNSFKPLREAEMQALLKDLPDGRILLFSKVLTRSDTDKAQNRLMLRKDHQQVLFELWGKPKPKYPPIDIDMIDENDPNLASIKFKFSYWESSGGYVFNGTTWAIYSKRRSLKEGDKIIVTRAVEGSSDSITVFIRHHASGALIQSGSVEVEEPVEDKRGHSDVDTAIANNIDTSKSTLMEDKRGHSVDVGTTVANNIDTSKCMGERVGADPTEAVLGETTESISIKSCDAINNNAPKNTKDMQLQEDLEEQSQKATDKKALQD